MADDGFYTSLKQLETLFKKGCTKRFAGTTPADLAAWQAESRALLKDLLGFDTFEGCDNNLTELGSEDCGEYIRIKYVLQTEAHVYMPFFVLIPIDLKPGERHPSVICPNGHFNRAKESVAAVRHEEGVLEDMENAHTHHAEDFVKRGYIAFCPDARGFGERAEKAVQKNGYKCSCTHLNRMGIPLGRSALGMQVWDLIKLADYIETRPDCDPQRITCAGLSGGGMQTLYFAAVDTRIACACTSGYFFGMLESRLHGNHHCDCNYVPDMWKYFDIGDIAALIAPRPLIIETGIHDDSNGISGMENVYAQVRIAQKAYDAAGCGDRLSHSVLDVGHRWVGTDVYPFFDKHV
jgi:hypothetical protein